MHDLEYAKQLLQYAIQVQQLADALKNTLHGGPASLTSIATDLGMLAAVVQGGRALAWSLANDDVVFRETYPGYPALAAVGPAGRGTSRAAPEVTRTPGGGPDQQGGLPGIPGA